MSSDSDRKRLEELNERIRAAKVAADPKASESVQLRQTQTRRAIKMIRAGSDFLATVVLSGAAGWYLDDLCATQPWLMLILLTVGFVAGFWKLSRLLIGPKMRQRDEQE